MKLQVSADSPSASIHLPSPLQNIYHFSTEPVRVIRVQKKYLIDNYSEHPLNNNGGPAPYSPINISTDCFRYQKPLGVCVGGRH